MKFPANLKKSNSNTKDIMALECGVSRVEKTALLSIVDTIDFLRQQRPQFSCQEMIQSSRGKMPIFNIYYYACMKFSYNLLDIIHIYVWSTILLKSEKIMNENQA